MWTLTFRLRLGVESEPGDSHTAANQRFITHPSSLLPSGDSYHLWCQFQRGESWWGLFCISVWVFSPTNTLFLLCFYIRLINCFYWQLWYTLKSKNLNTNILLHLNFILPKISFSFLKRRRTICASTIIRWHECNSALPLVQWRFIAKG